MVLFFMLSGFLITSFLLRRPNVPEFLIRRLFRILPLAWLYLAVCMVVAGADPKLCLALWYFHHGLRCRWRPPVGLSLLLAVLTLASAHSAMTWLCYFRPYLGAALIGTTLLNDQSGLARVLKGRTLAYLAKISYALYVVNGGLRYSWLASGDTLERYLKRPLFLLVCWALAHLSTHYYEARFLEIGRRLSLRFRKPDGA